MIRDPISPVASSALARETTIATRGCDATSRLSLHRPVGRPPDRDPRPKAQSFGYEGLELACWGDHFEVHRAATEDGYCEQLWDLLQKNGLGCYAISTHLVGQAVCDPIDERHQAILPPRRFGATGDPEGVRQRAAAKR